MIQRLRHGFYLFLFWVLLVFRWEPLTVAAGLVISFAVAWTTQPVMASLGIELPGPMVVGRYMVFLIREIMIASVQHIGRILSKEDEQVISFDLVLESGTRMEWVMMANLITLTPGTLSLDVGDSRIRVLALESSFRKREAIEQGLLDTYGKIFR